MKIGYVASASKADKRGVKMFVQGLVTVGQFVYVPALAFSGIETLEVRDRVMAHCFDTLAQFDYLILWWEGVHSVGMWQELERWLGNHIPYPIIEKCPNVCLANLARLPLPIEHIHLYKQVNEFRLPQSLLEWINVISPITRNSKSGTN